jgi:cytochrome c peroxidase
MNTLNPGPNNIFESGGVTAPGQIFNASNITKDDRAGSQGIVGSKFRSIDPNPRNPADICDPDQTAPFFRDRRVTGRNAPSVIGAAFNVDNFWDGRASHDFNGSDPFGSTGNAAFPAGFAGGLVTNASPASQADGPANNEVEMSCAGRPFNGPNSLAAKLLARQPLGLQVVSQTDSVLGGIAAFPFGLTKTYQQLINDAFGANSAIAKNARDRFSRIWGQAVQAYISTLTPDQTPLDLFLAGNQSTLTANQQRGLGVFSGKGQCSKCHAGPELTDASFTFLARKGPINEDGGDQGFHNNGVRPTAEDLGRAGLGPKGVSFSRSRAAVDHGAFKTPGLRNVKLTAPYFHNGGKKDLESVVDFYNKGGDFPNPELAKRIRMISLDSNEKSALVDFLRNGLTDPRVECERKPFDHPSLAVPNGDPTAPLPDRMLKLAAVGAAGRC